jgi:hypothetical protein
MATDVPTPAVGLQGATKTMAGAGLDGCDQLVDGGGDATFVIHKGREFEDNAEFRRASGWHGALLEAVAGGAGQGGATRHVAAAMVAAAARVVFEATTSSSKGSSEHGDHGDLRWREEVVAASLQAHEGLNSLLKHPRHNMGLALREAKPSLPADVAAALRKLQKMSGKAKHSWEDTQHKGGGADERGRTEGRQGG